MPWSNQNGGGGGPWGGGNGNGNGGGNGGVGLGFREKSGGPLLLKQLVKQHPCSAAPVAVDHAQFGILQHLLQHRLRVFREFHKGFGILPEHQPLSSPVTLDEL